MNNMNSRMSDSYCILLFRSLTNNTNTYTVLFSIRYLASTFTIKILSSRLHICPSFSFITTSGPFTTPLSCLSNTSSTGYCKTEPIILAVPHYSWKKKSQIKSISYLMYKEIRTLHLVCKNWFPSFRNQTLKEKNSNILPLFTGLG